MCQHWTDTEERWTIQWYSSGDPGQPPEPSVTGPFPGMNAPVEVVRADAYERLCKLVEPKKWLGWEQVDSIYEEARLLRKERDQAMARIENLRATIHNVINGDFHYSEEYLWSLQDALDADTKAGAS